MEVLVLGLGNAVMSDDGFGSRVIRHLSEHYLFDDNLLLLDGGTLGLDLLPRFEGVARLLIVDALNMDVRPGTVFRLSGEEVPRAFAAKMSVHQMGLQDLLAVAELQGHLPAEMVLWGVQAGSMEMGLELTRPVSRAIDRVVDGIVGELTAWGMEPVLRSSKAKTTDAGFWAGQTMY